MTIIESISQSLQQAVNEPDGNKAWRVLVDLSKEIKQELKDVYDIAEIRSETLIGEYMVKVKSKVSPHQLTQSEAEKIRLSIMKRFFLG